MNLDADMASTLIVLAVLLGGALAAVVADKRNPEANRLSTNQGDPSK